MDASKFAIARIILQQRDEVSSGVEGAMHCVKGKKFASNSH
jgi:hypothetical protein